VSLKFYLDDDSAEAALLDALRSRGLEVCTPADVRLEGADDRVHLDYCAEKQLTLVTHNIGDFHRLHKEFIAEGRSHFGIILMRQQTLSVGEKLRRLARISSHFSLAEMKNRVEFLSNWKAQIA
jgi:hypothetical protein